MPLPTKTSNAATARKTSAVHFLRFELTPKMITALRAGAALGMGVSHTACTQQTTVTGATRTALLQDFY